MSMQLASAVLSAMLILATYTPTSAYVPEEIEGFVVLWSPDTANDGPRIEEVRSEIEAHLALVSKALPAAALRSLRKTRIWVEWRTKPGAAVEFHSSMSWILSNRRNPDKFGGIVINNTQDFVKWSKSGHDSILLHELAHAYLHSLSDYEQLLVHLAYLSAVESGKYEAVRHENGQTLRAYALTDTQEYFAELSEGYFHRNDFFPFSRDEVKAHDEEGHAMLLRAWGVESSEPAPCDQPPISEPAAALWSPDWRAYRSGWVAVEAR